MTPVVQRAALVALYDATDGANWTRSLNWSTDVPVADWAGVVVDDSGSVTGLSLRGAGLSGSIPAEVGSLTDLGALDLSFNALSGPLPAEVGNLTSLVTLDLAYTRLSGSIPAEVGNLVGLEFLDLAYSGLSGPLPAEVGNLASLEFLSLVGNKLSGPLPAEVGNLVSLEYLYGAGNALSGPIPAEIGGLARLRVLELGSDVLGVGNNLSGPIPAEVGNLMSLEDLDLSHNRLSGPIPAEVGDLSGLTYLNVSNNDSNGPGLSGPIPAELGRLGGLRGLDLSNNSLSGSIPAELGRLSGLRGLDLSNNSLSGSIPAEVGRLTRLFVGLDLSGNTLSGPIPAELGQLVRLQGLDLSGNTLSGPIPAELGQLVRLQGLDLSGNTLSGPIPAELGDLLHLRRLDLSTNALSGCVPAVLASVREIAFDADLSYCAAARVSVTPARAQEGDEEAVFTVTATPPDGAAGDLPEVSVDYATAAANASAGRDYTPTTGTLTIPAGTRRATIAVPLIDDTTRETAESFTLQLTRPRGAVLEATESTATIIDNDPAPADPAAAVPVCDGAVATARVNDVYDVEQPGFTQWHHAFVDMDVSCSGDLSSAVSYPTAVSVIDGPAASLGSSRHCLTRTGARQTTASIAVAAGCRTYPSPAQQKFTQDGRSTHIVWIPDTAIGVRHRIRAWVDADSDGMLDTAEPYRDFSSDFVSRSVSDSGSRDYTFPESFSVEAVAGSTRVGRAGHYSVVVVRLTQPGGTALAGAPVRVSISAGPSRNQQVTCVNASGSGNAPASAGPCTTNHGGHLALYYQVPLAGADPDRMQHDVLRVHYDTDGDGTLDQSHSPTGIPYDAEPARLLYLPVAKAANYIALGDSYSSGEAGDNPESGAYQDGVSDADNECRRWNLAYPYIFNDDFLNNRELQALDIDVDFKTFACTGAETLHIHNPADPDGDSTGGSML